MSFGKHSGKKFSSPSDTTKNPDRCIVCNAPVSQGMSVCSAHIQGKGTTYTSNTKHRPYKNNK